MTTAEWVLVEFAIFMVGLIIGRMLEAHAWRESAGDYRRRASAGRFFVVREEHVPTHFMEPE